MYIHVIIKVKEIQEFDVIQFYSNHLQYSNVSTDTSLSQGEDVELKLYVTV